MQKILYSVKGTPKEVQAKTRLEYLRGEIEKECISYEEIAELQSLAEYIDDGDVVLLEWAGYASDNCECCGNRFLKADVDEDTGCLFICQECIKK